MSRSVALALFLAACGPDRSPEFQVAPPAWRVDAEGIQGKHMMGYQGWFNCPDDGANLGWVHWSRGGAPSPTTVTFDAWPDVSMLDPDELCATDFVMADGGPAPLFSSHHPKTVRRHTRWMRENDIDGVYLQRFTGPLGHQRHKAHRDRVTENVRAGSEANGRVFAIMYDISGTDPGVLVDRITQDWLHLVDDLGVVDSDRYLHHAGRPVVAIWGLGFHDRPGSVSDANAILDFFQNHPDPRYRTTVVGGVPTHWRTLTTDSKTDPGWADVYRRFDVISPWAVGRYADDAGADHFRIHQLQPDITAAHQAGALYMPVIFPGFSWVNLKGQGNALNAIPRRGGRFYWRQAYNVASTDADALYTAMFDEVDEATAMMPVASTAAEAPTTGTWLTLDADGETLPSDHYLRLAGEATRMMRGERAVSPQLPDVSAPQPPSPPTNPTPPVDPPQGWHTTVVTRAYRGILGREPDAGGLAGYVAQLDAGLSVPALANALWSSNEFAAGRGQLPPEALATALYEGILDRAGDPGGLASTAAAISAGNGAARAAEMLESPEAQNKPLSP